MRCLTLSIWRHFRAQLDSISTDSTEQLIAVAYYCHDPNTHRDPVEALQSIHQMGWLAFTASSPENAQVIHEGARLAFTCVLPWDRLATRPDPSGP